MKQLKMHITDVPTITGRGGNMNILISPNTVGSSHLVMGFSELGVNEKVNPHVHDYSEEAFFVLAGKGRIHLGDEIIIDFKSGDAVLVPKGKVHWIENTGDEPMKVIFSVSPLAPTPQVGHREVEINKEKTV